MNERDKEMILALRGKASTAMMEHIKQQIIFESRARGDSTEDSEDLLGRWSTLIPIAFIAKNAD
jgi:hypothetical protein